MVRFIPVDVYANTDFSDPPQIPAVYLDFPYFDTPYWEVTSPYIPIDYQVSPGKIAFLHPKACGHFFDPSRWEYVKNIRPYPIFLDIDGEKTLLAPGEAQYILGKTVSLTSWVSEDGSLYMGSWDDVVFITESEVGTDRYTKY